MQIVYFELLLSVFMCDFMLWHLYDIMAQDMPFSVTGLQLVNKTVSTNQYGF